MALQLKKFTIGSLLEIDSGKIGKAVQLALKQAVADIEDRPHDEKARKIGLTIHIVPTNVDRAGNVETCGVQFKIKLTVPDRESLSYSLRAGEGQELLFAPESPEDVNQHTIEGFRAPPEKS